MTTPRAKKKPPQRDDRMRLKLDILDSVLNLAQARAQAESEAGGAMSRAVTVSDVARDALFRAARAGADGDEHARAIALRSQQDGDRRRFPLIVPRAEYQAARQTLRERGLSVAFVVEQGLVDYARGETR